MSSDTRANTTKRKKQNTKLKNTTKTFHGQSAERTGPEPNSPTIKQPNPAAGATDPTKYTTQYNVYKTPLEDIIGRDCPFDYRQLYSSHTAQRGPSLLLTAGENVVQLLVYIFCESDRRQQEKGGPRGRKLNKIKAGRCLISHSLMKSAQRISKRNGPPQRNTVREPIEARSLDPFVLYSI